jgi:hypothetical protein
LLFTDVSSDTDALFECLSGNPTYERLRNTQLAVLQTRMNTVMQRYYEELAHYRDASKSRIRSFLHVSKLWF